MLAGVFAQNLWLPMLSANICAPIALREDVVRD